MPVAPLLTDRQLRERIIELVQDARKKLPETASTRDIEAAFSLSVTEEILPLNKDGAYLENESKIIINRTIISGERRRFTLFHELIHFLIREDGNLYSYLHDAYEDSAIFDRTIETLCNVGAAEFILPRDQVRALIDQSGFTIGLVPQLCQQEQASGPATLIQLIQCAPNRCYGVICEYGLPPNAHHADQQAFIQAHQSPTLYVLYAMWSPTEKYPLARFTTIPKDHFLSQVIPDGSLIKGKDRIPFRSGTDWSTPVEAIYFRGKVYGLFNVSPAPSPNQLRLL